MIIIIMIIMILIMIIIDCNNGYIFEILITKIKFGVCPPQDRPPQDRPPQDRRPQDRPPQDRPPQDRPPQDRPKFSFFFSLAHHNFHSFLLLLTVLNFGGVFEDQRPQMSTFGLSGCRRRASHDSPRTPNVHISGPRRFKHHQNSMRRHPREGRKNENCGGRVKKKSAKCCPPTLRGPTLRGPHPAGPHPVLGQKKKRHGTKKTGTGDKTNKCIRDKKKTQTGQ